MKASGNGEAGQIEPGFLVAKITRAMNRKQIRTRVTKSKWSESENLYRLFSSQALFLGLI